MADATVSPRARADLYAIYAYIAADNVDAAEALATRFDDIFQRLSIHPHLGRARIDIGPTVRSFAVGSYLVLYRPSADGVDIARVIHGSRDVLRVFRDDRA